MLVKIGNKSKPVRLSYPNLFKPSAVKGGEPRYSANFIIPPKHPSVKDINAAIEEVAIAKWGDEATKILSTLQKKELVCFRDGDLKSGSGAEAYEGNMYLAAGANVDQQPKIIDRDKSELIQSDGRPYSGCDVVASVDIWAQDNDFGKRINAKLRWVQFAGDNDAFGSVTAPVDEDEFEDLSDGIEDEDIA